MFLRPASIIGLILFLFILSCKTPGINPEKQNKIVVINFWSTFCSPCLKELPVFSKLKESYRNNQQISFYLIALNSPDEINRFISGDSTDILGNLYNKLNFTNTVEIIPYYKYSSSINTLSKVVKPSTQNTSDFIKLKSRYQIEGIPTTIIYYKGEEIKRFIGYSGDDPFFYKLSFTLDSLIKSQK